ncbi:MAG: hypothetical protein ABSD42_11980 [Candidatus Bathyarchaeia archaeon]|jgi:hypothetical protein
MLSLETRVARLAECNNNLRWVTTNTPAYPVTRLAFVETKAILLEESKKGLRRGIGMFEGEQLNWKDAGAAVFLNH